MSLQEFADGSHAVHRGLHDESGRLANVGSRVTLGVLGGLIVERDGTQVSLGGRKAQQIVAVLAANLDRTTSTDRLVDTLWDMPPASSVATVHSHVSRLRAVLGPEIEIRREADGYRLVLQTGTIDAARFEELLARSRSDEAPHSIRQLEEAVALWRGPAFGTHAELESVRAEAVRLEELRLVALDEWANARLEAGDAASMVGELEALIGQHPYRERFWTLLMLALHRTGRQAEALRRAAELRRMLGDETGLDVSPTVRELEARILADDPALLVGPPDTARAASGGAGQRRPGPKLLGSRLIGSTSFVGRELDVASVVDALGAHRLVTVTGPGGVGKTRLALRAAAAIGDRFDGDITVVELAPLRDAGGVTRMIAHALDIQQRQYRTLDATIEEYLASRNSLLVLDNCEHVVDSLAPLVDRLRTSCLGLTVLCTSRQPLGLAGEYVAVVAPLSLPEPGESSIERVGESEAVQLFIARSRTAAPAFTLTDENLSAVVGICRRLDGLPLGLELAAARLRAMGIEVLAERLEQRVQSLGQLQRSGDGRQRTLSELVRWSYDLLDPEALDVFTQLAVFAGGFDLDAVGAVCVSRRGAKIDTVEVLASLVEQSMVILVDPQSGRYRLLEPLREFALDRLAEDGHVAAVEGRHLDWFLDLAARGMAGLDTADEATWSTRLDRDFDNFRAAQRHALGAGDVDRALRLVAALREFGFRRVQYEITAWAHDAVTLPGASSHPGYSAVLAMCAYGHWVRGDLDAAIRLAQDALFADNVEDTEGLSASGLPERVLGNAHFYLGEPEAGLMWMDRMFDSAVVADDDARRTHGRYMQSVAQTSVGDSVRGAILAGEARAVAQRVGSPTAMAQAGYALGLALEGTDLEEAISHLEGAARLAGAAGNRWIEAFALTEVHWLRARGGEHLAGLAGFGQVVKTWYRGGDWANQWLSLRHVFGILTDLGSFEEAAVLHGALTAVGAAHALPFEPADAERLAGVVDDLRSLLGTKDFAEAVRRGASMTDSETVRFVIDHIEALTELPHVHDVSDTS